MLLEHKLGQERANALQVEQLDDVNLVGKALTSFLMPLKFLDTPPEAVLVADALAAAEEAQNACKHELAVVVEVLTSLSDLVHHGSAGLRLTLDEFAAVFVRKFLRIGARWVNRSNQ